MVVTLEWQAETSDVFDASEGGSISPFACCQRGRQVLFGRDVAELPLFQANGRGKNVH